MSDVTQHWRFSRIMVEAAQYRTLRSIYEADPQVGPQTAAMLRECFKSYRDDAAPDRDGRGRAEITQSIYPFDITR
jgi:hypothetical protein